MAKTSWLSKLKDALSLGGPATAVGMSVGSSSIKLIELKRSRKGWKLLHFGTIPLASGAIINREIANPIAVVESIRSLVSQLNLKTKSLCISVSGNSVIIKRMSLQVPSKKELDDQVFWEAEQYLPFDVSEVFMDYQVLSYSSDNVADVLLVAIKGGVLDSYLDAVKDAGVRAKVCDIDFFALQNIFELNYPGHAADAVALVDLGASSTKITIAHQGIPVFTKDSSMGGSALTSEIQKALGVSFEDAESLKVGAQDGPMPQEVSDLIAVAAENLSSEIKRSLDFYSASATGAPVAAVYLTGGGARIAQVSQMIGELVGKPVALLNPFAAIEHDPAVFTQDYLDQIAPVAALSAGLALRMGPE